MLKRAARAHEKNVAKAAAKQAAEKRQLLADELQMFAVIRLWKLFAFAFINNYFVMFYIAYLLRGMVLSVTDCFH